MWSHTDTDQFISLWTSLQVDSQPMLKPSEKVVDMKGEVATADKKCVHPVNLYLTCTFEYGFFKMT